MARKDTSSGKAAAKPLDGDMSEGEDVSMRHGDDDGMDTEGDSIVGTEDDDMEDVLASPSPSKKGMTMRSGRSKRRRSKETTGLTPPEEKKTAKKARIATQDRTKKRQSVVQAERTNKASKAEEAEPTSKPPKGPESRRSQVAPGSSVLRRFTATTKSTRSSISSSDAVALARAQDPESSLQQGGTLNDADSNRKLFDPPTITNLELSPPSPPPQLPEDIGETVAANDNGSDQTRPERIPGGWETNAFLWRVGFMLLFAFPAIVVWPICVKVSNVIVPLRELVLPEANGSQHVVSNGDQFAAESLEPPASLSSLMEVLPKIQGQIERARQLLEQSTVSSHQQLEGIVSALDEKRLMLERMSSLSKAEGLLRSALENIAEGTGLNTLPEVQATIHSIGHVLIDISTLSLWEVDGPENCEEVSAAKSDSTETSAPPIHDVAVKPNDLDEQRAELKQTTQMSVASLMMSAGAEEAVRRWIRSQLEAMLQGNDEATNAISKLQGKVDDLPDDSSIGLSSGISVEQAQEITKARLENEMADHTGDYDHAAIYNGATIIRDGKRATSGSMVDFLPLGNRLLQLSQLQFYGFGPEAAITPTYPADALGQCWSFNDFSIEDLQKRQVFKPNLDEHKNGSIGTLTIKMRNPVVVRSIVIEHPSRGITDQTKSAIRSFRLLGFDDPLADTSPWLLGSFEYDISK